jgi:hypothetical protein
MFHLIVDNNYVVNRAHGRTFFKNVKKGIDLWIRIRARGKRVRVFVERVAVRNVTTWKVMRAVTKMSE